MTKAQYVLECPRSKLMDRILVRICSEIVLKPLVIGLSIPLIAEKFNKVTGVITK